ncbi:SAGA-associated factor 29-like [Pterocles gutturalis]
MALVSADSRIAELLGERHQPMKQTQVTGFWGGGTRFSPSPPHRLPPFLSETHERVQTENKISPCYRPKLRGLYTGAEVDAEAERNILRKALDKITEIKSLLEERRIAAKITGIYSEAEPPRKTMHRGVLMTLLQQSAVTLPLWISKPGEKYEVDDIDEEGKEGLPTKRQPQDDYLVLFEDTSYANGYSPPLNVAQRYV